MAKVVHTPEPLIQRKPQMIDNNGRNINYLRLSITDRCNMRCSYCMPPDGLQYIPHADILTFDEIMRLLHIFSSLGIQKLKVTGGEPLVRKDACELLKSIHQANLFQQVTITSNGVLIPQFVKELKQAGISAVNISLDTLNSNLYANLTRCNDNDLDKTLTAIKLLNQNGIAVKINTVPLKNIPLTEYFKVIYLAKEQVQAVRFIELMPIGSAHISEGLSINTLKDAIQQEYGTLEPYHKKLGNGPASYYTLKGFKGKIGFIEALSHEFCSECNRLRLSANGFLKLCLASPEGIDLKTPLRQGASNEEIAQIIYQVVQLKPDKHHFNQADGALKRSMSSIGG